MGTQSQAAATARTRVGYLLKGLVELDMAGVDGGGS